MLQTGLVLGIGLMVEIGLVVRDMPSGRNRPSVISVRVRFSVRVEGKCTIRVAFE